MRGTICGRSYEIKYAFLEKCQTLRISYTGIQVVPFNIVEGKKEFLKKSCVTFKRGILFICRVI